ncbi:MAG: protein kinase [Cryobacterium sp.]|nr:protein kinase [Oligoflexia bacterium]
MKDLQPLPQKYGKYVLLQRLTAGGMAEVFLATPLAPESRGLLVVLKRMPADVSKRGGELAPKMFKAEIQVTMGLNHPYVIQCRDFGEVNGQPYFVTDFLEGQNLRQVMNEASKKGIRLPVPTVLHIIAQAALGLGYAHRFRSPIDGSFRPILHRDLSPHNVMLSYDGTVKIIDFGTAKIEGGASDLTKVGELKGKCGYFAPEQLAGEAADPRSDLFSLGIVAWEMLTLRRLFSQPGDQEIDTLRRIENSEKYVSRPSALNGEVPNAVDEVILSALHKRPGDRYANANDFYSAITRVLQKNYPDFTVIESGDWMRELFSAQIRNDRTELQKAYALAKPLLVSDDLPFAFPIDRLPATAKLPAKNQNDDATQFVGIPAGFLNSQEGPRSQLSQEFDLEKVLAENALAEASASAVSLKKPSISEKAEARNFAQSISEAAIAERTFSGQGTSTHSAPKVPFWQKRPDIENIRIQFSRLSRPGKVGFAVIAFLAVAGLGKVISKREPAVMQAAEQELATPPVPTLVVAPLPKVPMPNPLPSFAAPAPVAVAPSIPPTLAEEVIPHTVQPKTIQPVVSVKPSAPPKRQSTRLPASRTLPTALKIPSKTKPVSSRSPARVVAPPPKSLKPAPAPVHNSRTKVNESSAPHAKAQMTTNRNPASSALNVSIAKKPARPSLIKQTGSAAKTPKKTLKTTRDSGAS